MKVKKIIILLNVIILQIIIITTTSSYGMSITLKKSVKITASSVSKIKFMDNQQGFIVTFEDAIWETIDGGKSWTKIFKSPKDIFGLCEIIDVVFLSKSEGYVLLSGKLCKLSKINKKWLLKNIPLPFDDNFYEKKLSVDRKGKSICLFGGVERKPTIEEIKSDIRITHEWIGDNVIEPAIYCTNTSSQGHSWERVNDANGILGKIYTVSVNPMMLGIAAGYEHIYIKKSINEKWLIIEKLIHNNFFLVDSKADEDHLITSIFYLNNSNIWIAYRNGNINKICIDKCSETTSKPNKKNFTYFEDMFFFNVRDGMALDGLSRNIYFTSDGGSSWIAYGSEKWEAFNFLSNGVGWLVNSNKQLYSATIKFDDDGKR